MPSFIIAHILQLHIPCTNAPGLKPGRFYPFKTMDSTEQLHARPCTLAWLQSGGGKAPQQSSASKKAEKLQLQLMNAQLKASKKPMEFPEMAAAVPEPAPIPAPPPPAQTSSDQINAEQETRRQAGRRKGIQATMLTKPKAANPYALGGTATLLG